MCSLERLIRAGQLGLLIMVTFIDNKYLLAHLPALKPHSCGSFSNENLSAFDNGDLSKFERK
jgi:hypothetical protein